MCVLMKPTVACFFTSLAIFRFILVFPYLLMKAIRTVVPVSVDPESVVSFYRGGICKINPGFDDDDDDGCGCSSGTSGTTSPPGPLVAIFQARLPRGPKGSNNTRGIFEADSSSG